MDELEEIAKLLKSIGKRLESFSNLEKYYNNALSEDISQMGVEANKMSNEIKIIKEFFYGI